jgi:hypothetical protein
MLGAAMLVGAIGLGACVDTKYDSSIPSGPTTAPSTTQPTGTAAELLPRLLAASATLSATISAAGDKTAVVDQIESLWAAAQREVAATRPELLGGFESNVAKFADAARFNRAADADKAYKNLQALVDSYLATPISAG